MLRTLSFFSCVIVVATTVALGLLLWDWFPFVANVDDGLRLLGAIGVGYVWVALGIGWLVTLLFIRVRRARWRRGAYAPVVCMLPCAVLLLALAIVVPSDFESSREELVHLSTEARMYEPGWHEFYGFEHPREAGRADVLSISHQADGAVLIKDADAGVLTPTTHGWWHAAQDKDGSQPPQEWNPQPLGDGWFRVSHW